MSTADNTEEQHITCADELNNLHITCTKTKEVDKCANCGKEGSDGLKACTACKIVKYCNRDCQIAHRPKHKKACRKRAAELHDLELFKQPPKKEDCPICMLPLPLLHTGFQYRSCCGKIICGGCVLAVALRDEDEQKCPFCRTPAPYSIKEFNECLQKRVELDDSGAIFMLGNYYRNGDDGFPQDYTKALELFVRAGDLGHAKAYCNVGYAYENGRGVEKDKKKATHYYELAAIGGDVTSRYNLGNNEQREGNMNRALSTT